MQQHEEAFKSMVDIIRAMKGSAARIIDSAGQMVDATTSSCNLGLEDLTREQLEQHHRFMMSVLTQNQKSIGLLNEMYCMGLDRLLMTISKLKDE